jgi:dTDP-4-dehydrorhamnose reductase
MDSPAPKILLLGAAGQVGRELAKILPEIGAVKAVSREHCDLSDGEQVDALLAGYAPDIIVNAAAYTAVDKAESEQSQARRLNSELPTQLAAYAADQGVLLVDYSTDYIFDGTQSEPWEEGDSPSPVNVYGRSKLAGLQGIQQSGCRYLVFVVSWVYSADGQNFPRTMVRLAKERTELTVVADQYGAPTPADWIASITAHCLKQAMENPKKCGLYNLSPSGSTNWAEFAREVLQSARENGCQLKMEPHHVKSISTVDYPTAAKRPANSRLNCNRLKQTFGVETPSWRLLFRRQGSINW